MRLLLLLLCLTATTSAQTPWKDLHFGQSRDSVRSQLENLNLPVESTPDTGLQTNKDYPLVLPGLLYPIPIMATFHFDADSRLAEITLAVDLPAMRHDLPSPTSDEALYSFVADKLAFALAGEYGAPIFSSPTCNTENSPCTLQWRDPNQLIQLERIPGTRHLRIHYLPIATSL
jgi:hypothetical protein